MKQLGRGSQRIPLHGVLLYLEDFFSVLGLLKENCDVVKVTADGFALDDPETEILQLKDRLNRSEVFELKIEGSQLLPGTESLSLIEGLSKELRYKYPPLASLSLSGDLGYLTYDADDPKAKGLSEWILERLTHRRLAMLLGTYPWLYTVVGMGYVAPWLVVVSFVKNRILALSLIAAWSLLFLLRSARWLLHEKGVAVLRLENRSNRTNFFARNKDQLALLVITNLLTALLTLAVTLFVESLKAPTQEQSSPSTIRTTK